MVYSSFPEKILLRAGPAPDFFAEFLHIAPG
jgi:hypothetical protein